jgi:hypothetical protein
MLENHPYDQYFHRFHFAAKKGTQIQIGFECPLSFSN